jgi:hypothetical protein
MDPQQTTAVEQTGEPPVIETPQPEAKPDAPQSNESARRLRQLLAVPERDRSDEVWDEIISLEIELAPGNRISASQPDMGRGQEGGGRRQPQRNRQGQGQGQPRPQAAAPSPGNKPARRFFKRSRRGPGSPQGKR